MRISWQERPEALYFLQFSLLSILMISLLRQAAIMRMTCRRAISGQFCGIMRLEVWKWHRQKNVTFIIEDHLWGQSAKRPYSKGLRLPHNSELRVLPFASCAALSQWLNLSEPPFPHLWNMDNNGTYLRELSELKTGKLTGQCQTHSKLSVNVRLKHTDLIL